MWEGESLGFNFDKENALKNVGSWGTGMTYDRCLGRGKFDGPMNTKEKWSESREWVNVMLG